MDVDEKNKRLDINCIIGEGTQINLEMQRLMAGQRRRLF